MSFKIKVFIVKRPMPSIYSYALAAIENCCD